MVKILFTAFATLFLILFGVQNSDHVPISFIIGSPTNIRLVFLLASAAAGGFLISYIRGLSREITLKKEIRRLLNQQRLEQQRPLQIADDLEEV